MATVTKKEKVRSYFREGRLVKAHTRTNIFNLKDKNKNSNSKNKQQLTPIQKVGAVLGATAVISGVGYALYKTGVLNPLIAKLRTGSKSSGTGYAPNNSVTSIQIRRKSVQEIENDIFGNLSKTINIGKIKIRKTPPMLATSIYTLFNAKKLEKIGQIAKNLPIVDKEAISRIDSFIAKYPNNELSEALVKSKFAFNKQKTSYYHLNGDVIKKLQFNLDRVTFETNSELKRDSSLILSRFNDKDFISSSWFELFENRLDSEQRSFLLTAPATARKYPYIKHEMENSRVSAALDLEQHLSRGYDLKYGKAKSINSNIDKKLKSLRTSAERVAGPEGDNAAKKYEELLRKYKGQNPEATLSSESTSEYNNKKIKFLRDFGFTQYNFEGLSL